MNQFSVSTGKVALVASTRKNVVWLKAGANTPFKIKRLIVQCDGRDYTKGDVTLELVRFSANPSGGTALDVVSKGSIAEGATAQLTAALTPTTAGTEVAQKLGPFFVPEFASTDDRVPLGDEVKVGKAEVIAVFATSSDGVNVNVLIEVEE